CGFHCYPFPETLTIHTCHITPAIASERHERRGVALCNPFLQCLALNHELVKRFTHVSSSNQTRSPGADPNRFICGCVTWCPHDSARVFHDRTSPRRICD